MTGPDSQPRKPVILTVDDDPAVSRAVARDLRRHYGERYRIVRAESGPDALETLKELKLRGDTVAVFVADYRMPQMSGIEFLEKAMDIFPLARRVLLTAYADTHAAIDAINVVDLDHYLLKPWDPPEEKLYPVIDGLLEAWRAAGDRAMPYTKVIGHRWNAAVVGGARSSWPATSYSFRGINADEPKGQQLLEAAGLDDLRLPVVITEKRRDARRADRRRAGRHCSACRPARRWRCTTSRSSAAGPPVWPPRCTARPRASRPCSSRSTTTGGQAGPQLAHRELPRLPRPASRAPSSPRVIASARRRSSRRTRSLGNPSVRVRRGRIGAR